jgi:hypothetical protein
VDLTVIVVVVIVTALAFDFANGFHDTAHLRDGLGVDLVLDGLVVVAGVEGGPSCITWSCWP